MTTTAVLGSPGAATLGLSAAGGCTGALNGKVVRNAPSSLRGQALTNALLSLGPLGTRSVFTGYGTLRINQASIAVFYDVIGSFVEMLDDFNGHAYALLSRRPPAAGTVRFTTTLAVVRLRG